MPQNLMSMRTSLAPSGRRPISRDSSGASAVGAPKARAVVAPGDGLPEVGAGAHDDDGHGYSVELSITNR